jgi:hypothetical protein
VPRLVGYGSDFALAATTTARRRLFCLYLCHHQNCSLKHNQCRQVQNRLPHGIRIQVETVNVSAVAAIRAALPLPVPTATIVIRL